MNISKVFVVVICAVVLLFSCKPKVNEPVDVKAAAADTVVAATATEEQDAEEEMLDTRWDSDTTGIMGMNVRLLMDKILPQVIQYAECDTTSAIFYNNAIQLRLPSMEVYLTTESDTTVFLPHAESGADTSVVLLVGKLIDKKQVFAVTYTEVNSQICFYRLHNGQWKGVGRRKTDIPVGKIYAEEFNGKPGMEIVAATWWNMNGNSWQELFYYSEKEDKVKFAGDFCTTYHINLKDTTVTEMYEGSSYMDQHKTLYVWHNDMMVPLRTTVLVSSEGRGEGVAKIEYYENPTLTYPKHGLNDLKLIFREVYDQDGKKHQQYWDSFFEQGKTLK